MESKKSRAVHSKQFYIISTGSACTILRSFWIIVRKNDMLRVGNVWSIQQLNMIDRLWLEGIMMHEEYVATVQCKKPTKGKIERRK